MKPSKPKKEFKNSKPNCKSGEVKEGTKKYTLNFNIDYHALLKSFDGFEPKRGCSFSKTIYIINRKD